MLSAKVIAMLFFTTTLAPAVAPTPTAPTISPSSSLIPATQPMQTYTLMPTVEVAVPFGAKIAPEISKVYEPVTSVENTPPAPRPRVMSRGKKAAIAGGIGIGVAWLTYLAVRKK